jgi:hypothetical protein
MAANARRSVWLFVSRIVALSVLVTGAFQVVGIGSYRRGLSAAPAVSMSVFIAEQAIKHPVSERMPDTAPILPVADIVAASHTQRSVVPSLTRITLHYVR